jgi:Uncharacterized protein involved in formation of curli polymers
MRHGKMMFAFALSLLVAASAVAAERPRLAVAEFKNETRANWWTTEAAKDLAGMLTNELSSSGKFRLVERQKLSQVLDEQDLAESGRISRSTGAKVGKLTGAQYLVIATVTAYETQTAGTGGGLSFRGISVGGKKEDAYLAIDLRVVDTTTGDVEYTRTVEGRATNYGMGGAVYRGGWGGSLGKYENTPTGKAIRGAIVEIAEYLECAMVDKDSCMNEYSAKEKSRRNKTKSSIKIE